MAEILREKLSFESKRRWCSTKESPAITTHWLVNWKMFCSLWSQWLIELLPCMDVTEMLDTRISNELCTCHMTSSSGLEWPCRCRRPLVAANSASNRKALMLWCQCSLSLSLLPWIATPALQKHWDDYGVGPPTKCGECFGLLWPLYQPCHGLHDPWSDCKDCCQVSLARIHLYLQSTSQAPEWPRSQFLEQHHKGTVWTHGHRED